MGAVTAIHDSVIIVALGIVVTALETIWLALHGAYEQDGVWPWVIVRECYRTTTGRFLSPFSSTISLITVLGGRIASVIWLLYDYHAGNTAVLPLTFLVVTHFIVSLRNRWGGEGGDQMTALVMISGLSADAFPTVAPCAALFIGAQITLSYLASGSAKLFGPLWREGTALQKIMSNYAYGNPWLSKLLSGHPYLCKAACFSVILFQISFLLFYLLPSPFAYIYLLAGALFHLAIAFFMRLNLFCFAFIGTYPCLLFARETARTALGI
jgi:hypothetical protein